MTIEIRVNLTSSYDLDSSDVREALFPGYGEDVVFDDSTILFEWYVDLEVQHTMNRNIDASDVEFERHEIVDILTEKGISYVSIDGWTVTDISH